MTVMRGLPAAYARGSVRGPAQLVEQSPGAHRPLSPPALPDNLAFLRGSPVFIPWADVEQIILYPSRPG
jgi:hypothetical protein